MRALGIEAAEIDIRPTARQMLGDMGHAFSKGEPVYDITFENVQAGLRTDFLFRLANQRNGFVIGTGDLSELALGWCTYGVGDQMSHYNVNAGVPKTLIQYLIRWTVASGQFDEATGQVLTAILATEISPELVPADASGAIQSTQAKIGPYELNDFFLFHTMRYGQPPAKVAFLAWHAWRDASAGRWPANFPRREEPLRPRHDPPLAGAIPRPVLPDGAVQAHGHAERAEGLGRRQPFAARRLARAVGRLAQGVDGRYRGHPERGAELALELGGVSAKQLPAAARRAKTGKQNRPRPVANLDQAASSRRETVLLRPASLDA